MLLIVLAITAVLGWMITIVATTKLILCPPRMTDGKATYVLQRVSPLDLGMAYKDVTYSLRVKGSDEPMKIAGWWIPTTLPSTKTVVLIHGFADAKVGAIAWAPTWRAMGFNILAIDLRAHGESGGRTSTGGYFERHDLSAIVNQLRAEEPDATKTLVLFGASLGGAIALATAAMRTDIDAVVMDSPFDDYRQAIRRHLQLWRLPTSIIAAPSVALAKWITGANFDEVRPVDLIAKVPCPVLLIQSGNDQIMTARSRARLDEAMQASSSAHIRQVVTINTVNHLHGLAIDPERYRRIIETFFAALDQNDPILPSPASR